MTTYYPCLRCPMSKGAAACERKKEVSEKIRGAGLTLLRFKCDIYANMFPRGTRVSVFVRASKAAGSVYDPALVNAWWTGTVVGPARIRDKWLVFLDDLPEEEGYARYVRSANNVVPAYAIWMKPLDEPRDLGRIQELRRRESSELQRRNGLPIAGFGESP